MAQLLHIDASITGEQSVSRRLTARAVRNWQAAHPGGAVAYRDLGAEPVPHLLHSGLVAHQMPPEAHDPEHAASHAMSRALVEELATADTIVLGLPLYNYGPPSAVKAWVDHFVVAGLSIDPEDGPGRPGSPEFVVIHTRGGGYGPGTPRDGWDHAEAWLPHAVASTGLQPRFITAELTLSGVNPELAHLKPQAAESLAAAERAIDELWVTLPV